MRNLLKKNALKIGVLMWFGALGFLFFLVLFPLRIVTVSDFVVKNAQVKRGDFVYYSIKIDKKVNVKADSVSWYLVNGHSYKLDDIDKLAPKGLTLRESNKYIPNDLKVVPGVYKLRLEVTYRPTSISLPKTYVIESNEFEVVE